MLAVHIIVVGRDKSPWIADQVSHFTKLISRYANLEMTVIPEAHYKRPEDIDKDKAAEARKIDAQLRGGHVIALDTTGKLFSTENLAAQFDAWQENGISRLEFVIGGPYGLDTHFKRKCDICLSLSPLTFSHQIARLILLEQIYRVLNLNAGGSYHK